MVVGSTTTNANCQSVPITTNVVSAPVSSTNKTDRYDITEILLTESDAKHHNPSHNPLHVKFYFYRFALQDTPVLYYKTFHILFISTNVHLYIYITHHLIKLV